MATLEDVARSLGMSKRAVRSRVNALGDMLEGHLIRGERNRLIFRGEAVSILRRLEELRQRERLPIRKAATVLRGELAAQDSDIVLFVKPELELALLQDALREACKERNRWREYALSLQAVLPSELKWMISTAPPEAEDRRLN